MEYKDGYEENEGQSQSFLIPSRLLAPEFAKLLDKLEATVPDLQDKFAAAAEQMCEKFASDSESDWRMTPKKSLVTMNVLAALSGLNPEAPDQTLLSDLQQYTDQILKILTLPRVLWGHFQLELPTLSYSATDMGMAALEKKFGPQDFTRDQTSDIGASLVRGKTLWPTKGKACT